MPDESPDPFLSFATATELFAELERRWPDFVFCGRGTTLHDGQNGFTMRSSGDSDTRVGMARRITMLETWYMREELRAATDLTADDEGED